MSTAANNGGSAFPLPLGTANCSEPEQSGGMTLRDYFAAHALAGYFAAPYTQHMNAAHIETARYCYEMADAMLRVRNANDNEPLTHRAVGE
jgi:hypothetical protein